MYLKSSYVRPFDVEMKYQHQPKRARKIAKDASDDDDDDKDEDEVTFDVNSRSIYFTGEVNSNSIKKLRTSLNKINKHLWENWMMNEYIYLTINSEGGSYFDSVSAMEFIKNNPFPVCTIAEGLCASAAVMIYMGGEYRISRPSTSFLIHSIRSVLDGLVTHKDLTEEAQNSDFLTNNMWAQYKERTTLSKSRYDKLMSGEYLLSAKDVKAFGLCHEIS